MKRDNSPPPASSDPTLAGRARAALERFVHLESASGVVLLAAAAVALVWANSPYAAGYQHLWHTLVVGPEGFRHSQPLHFWINDVLMTVFFLVVGMEIRGEIHDGALSNLSQAALPVLAALGGVIAPALLFLALNLGTAGQRGWAVPTATDIAFAVGVLALLGPAVPANVRVFLLALAIIDDIVAVLIIASVYAGGFVYGGFAIAAIGIALVIGLRRFGAGSAFAYLLPGAIVWFGLFEAGVHPTLAGVVLGLMTPVVSIGRHAEPPVSRVQTALHPWVAYGIMPLFALANAGVSVRGLEFNHEATFVTLGVAIALFAGKPIGVIGATWTAVRMGWGKLPSGVSWAWICLIGLLAGIGFTMSIFIAMLAFTDVTLLSAAKLGVLIGSVAAGFAGLTWGRNLRKAQRG